MHDWLIGLVLEVRIPSRAELWAWPRVHHLEFLLSGSDLNTSFDTIGGEWTSAVDVPLLEDTLLDRRVTTNKVVERLNMRLRTVRGEREVVVLKVETDAWQVDEGLDASLAELLWVTNTRALKNKWRAEGTARHDNLLAGLDDSGRDLSAGKVLGRHDLDTNSAVALENDLQESAMVHVERSKYVYLVDLVACQQVQVLVNGTSAVDISVGRVRSTTSIAVDPLQPVLSTMSGNQVLKIVGGRNALCLDRSQEILLDRVGVVAE